MRNNKKTAFGKEDSIAITPQEEKRRLTFDRHRLRLGITGRKDYRYEALGEVRLGE